MATERDMLNALTERYTARRPGALADRFVRAEQVRSTQDAWRSRVTVADFMAIDKWRSSQSLHGHEVKVSRADWLTELKDPTKSEQIKAYCNRWWLVVSTASIVKDDLPEDWGLMVMTKTGLRAKKAAPLLEPVDLSLDFMASFASAVQRTAMREHQHRDAASAFIGSWEPKCSACGEPYPCRPHQPREWDRLHTAA